MLSSEERDQYVAALRSVAENAHSLHRVKVRVTDERPNEFQISGYKNDSGMLKEFTWVPANPDNPALPTGGSWRE